MSRVFLNGEIVESTQALIPASDAGFLYGAGLFETMRADSGKVFAIDDHLDRLFFSAKATSVSIGLDKESLKDAIDSVLQANGLKNARIRLTVSNGAMGTDDITPTVLITAVENTGYPEEYYKKGIKVVLSSYRQNSTDPLAGHKTTSYYSRLIALDQARQKHCAEAIWFTVDNRLAEGCVSNILLVKDNVIYTPGLETPVLAGIARKTIFEIAKQQDIQTIEKDLYIHDLLEADEVFMTNVIMKVLPATSIENHIIKDGKVGKITKQLTECFNILLKKNSSKED
jgi:branched-chain amino acid aminotransferase